MKILYVTTISNTVNAFLVPHIKMLIENGHTVDVAFNIEQDVNPAVLEMGCKINVICFARNPLKLQNIKAYKELKQLIKEEKYDLVHTHTPTASMLVRLVCRKFRKQGLKVFYTAHGFHFFKGAPLLNWLIYYPIEKQLSKYTDTLITINKEDYARAKNKLHSKNVEYIPGVGIDVDKYINTTIDRDAKREELSIPKDDFFIFSVGELNSNKNHEIIIRAIAKLERTDIIYVICGTGHLRDYLKNLAIKLGVKLNLMGYRIDIAEICKTSDLFAFSSKREGLPVSVMEAMASDLPVICSSIRGCVDLVDNSKGGYLVESDNVQDYVDKIHLLYENKTIRNSMAIYNLQKVSKYDTNNILTILKPFYERIYE